MDPKKIQNNNFLNRCRTWIKTQSIIRRNRANKYILTTTGFIGIFAYIWYAYQPSEKAIGKFLEQVSEVTVPYFLREGIYGRYARKYGVNLQEMEKDIKEYANFRQFFTRKIKPRPELASSLQDPNTICSPCDAQILNISKIESNTNLIIKNISYSLSNLLFQTQDPTLPQKLRFNPSTQTTLYQIILYLSPGDYHRFHAPYQMQVQVYRDIAGRLRPVNVKSLMESGAIVYECNARKVLIGSYQGKWGGIGDKGDKGEGKGCLGMVMVGAKNVGNIVVEGKRNFGKGEQMGYFSLGSTIVLIVEVPNNCQMQKNIGDKVKYGETLCKFQQSV